MNTKKIVIIVLIAVPLLFGAFLLLAPAVVLNVCDDAGCDWFNRRPTPSLALSTFEECVAAGNPIMESYPRQCRVGSQLFTETITVAEFTSPNVNVTTPLPNATVQSPLVITGEAKAWYFEASFPVILKDANGTILAQAPAQAQGDWMTPNFVPFSVTLTFAKPTTATGTLIFQKDNPSGLPENDAEEKFTVFF